MMQSIIQSVRTCLSASLLAVMALMTPSSHATTFWTGPNVTWTKSAATPVDVILPGKITLTRGSREVLYNTSLESSTDGVSSPKGTMWAFGTFASHGPFQTMEAWRAQASLNL